jgi:hypothetical protein
MSTIASEATVLPGLDAKDVSSLLISDGVEDLN